MKLKNISKSWYFLIIILIAYIFLLILNKALFNSAISFFGKILLEIIPTIILIFILTFLSNYFVNPEFIMKHLGRKGIKKWFYVIIGGILSSGPIYMWYPLLANLKEKGLSYGLIACFLYNRAIKIPLLPLAIFYFNWKLIIVLTFVMTFMSIIQGILINKAMEIKK